MARKKRKKELEKRFMKYVLLIKTITYIIMFVLLLLFVLKLVRILG